MVTYDGDNKIIYTPFFGHVASESISSIDYMYESFIERSLYETLDYEGFGRVISTYQNIHIIIGNGVDYIY